MRTPFTLAAGKIPAVVLACVLLAACSTTQKGSTGSGTQEAAPISEGGKSQTGGADSPAGTASGQAGSSSAAATSPGTSSGSQASAAAGKGDEEAARLQQQLSDQEAEINRMRDEQVKAQQLADEEAAKQRAADDAAATGGSSASGSQQGAGGSPQAAAEAAAAAAAAGAASQSSAAAEAAQAADQPAAGQPLARSIYFRYDDATIADEYDSVLIAHAAFLKANPDFKAEVQGNCDERGSREYNLALGARRAEAVKRGLELAGADGSKIKATSFGAEKPVAFGQDEESYRQNRRADILY